MTHLKNKNVFRFIMFSLAINFMFNNYLLSFDDFKQKDDEQFPIPIKYYRNKQWIECDNYYSYVKEDVVFLFDESSIDSLVVAKLKKYDSITVIFRKIVKDEIWVMVGWRGDKSLSYGWIKENQVLFKDQFKPVELFKYKSIRINYSNVLVYNFKKNGDFEVIIKKYIDIVKEPVFVEILKGKAYMYDNILWLNVEDKPFHYANMLYSIKLNNELVYVGAPDSELQDERISFELYSDNK